MTSRHSLALFVFAGNRCDQSLRVKRRESYTQKLSVRKVNSGVLGRVEVIFDTFSLNCFIQSRDPALRAKLSARFSARLWSFCSKRSWHFRPNRYWIPRACPQQPSSCLVTFTSNTRLQVKSLVKPRGYCTPRVRGRVFPLIQAPYRVSSVWLARRAT